MQVTKLNQPLRDMLVTTLTKPVGVEAGARYGVGTLVEVLPYCGLWQGLVHQWYAEPDQAVMLGRRLGGRLTPGAGRPEFTVFAHEWAHLLVEGVVRTQEQLMEVTNE